MFGTGRHGGQICILIVAKNHLENKTNFLEEHDFFKWFWDLEWKSFRLLTNVFSALLTKLRFASPEYKFDSFFKTISIFFIIFEIWFFFAFCNAKFSAQSSKVLFTCTDEHLMKNWFSAGTCNSFFITFGFQAKNCVGLSVEKIRTAFRSAFYLSGGSIWKTKQNSWKKLVVFIFLGLGTEINLTVGDLLSALLTKLRFPSP